jgi:glycosyltransferase involved in cell wall biosynthesis
MKPLITALVDTYNQEVYIEQALVSVLDQGLSAAELEIVVVDDGSSDKTPDIVRKFVPRVKYLRKENGGQASAFNAGFAEVRGEMVALLDGDDWWSKSKLTTVAEAFEKNPEVAAVSHAYYRFDEKTKEQTLCGPLETVRLNLATPAAAVAALRGWAYLQPSALTVRKTVLAAALPIPEILVFSADSAITVAAMAKGALVLPEPLSYYRFHSGNLWSVDPSDREKLRRKSEMDEAMYEVLYPMLRRLGIAEESIRALLDHGATEARRFGLRTFGGSRLKTLRTETGVFHAEFRKPSLGYLLFKYLLMAPAALLLPPQRFYQARDWYARRNLGRVRDWFFKAGRRGEKRWPSQVK